MALFFTNIWFILLCLQVKWRGLEVQVNIKLKTADCTLVRWWNDNMETSWITLFFFVSWPDEISFQTEFWLMICWDCQTPCRTYGKHHGQSETSGHAAKQYKQTKINQHDNDFLKKTKDWMPHYKSYSLLSLLCREHWRNENSKTACEIQSCVLVWL